MPSNEDVIRALMLGKSGMPDSGPFMRDKLSIMSKMYSNLAPPLKEEDPFKNLAPAVQAGQGVYVPPFVSPYSGKTYGEGHKYITNPYGPSTESDI